jgi:Fe-S cluster assembly ATPase SufC
MNSASYVALSTALEQDMPSVLEDMLLQIERTRMEREDLAARFHHVNDYANKLELRAEFALHALSGGLGGGNVRRIEIAESILQGDDSTDSVTDMETDDEEL